MRVRAFVCVCRSACVYMCVCVEERAFVCVCVCCVCVCRSVGGKGGGVRGSEGVIL